MKKIFLFISAHKNTMKILWIAAFFFGIISCDDNSLPDCVKGKVIEFPSCNSVNVIQVLSGNLEGGSISSTGVQLEDVVLVPGRAIEDSIIYFSYRFFDHENNLDSVYCTRDVYIDAPHISITNYSNSNCPYSNEK